MRNLNGQVAIVTGGSRGIGASIAKSLAAEGAIVIVNYVKNVDAARQVVNDIEASGSEGEAIQADLTDPKQVESLFNEVREGFGRLDILVNNAGVAEFVNVEDIDVDHISRIFDLNFTALALSTKYAALAMKDGGRIINISSGAARSTPPNCPVHAASKAAVEAFTQSVAAALGPKGIRVNCVAPGLTVTDMLEAVIPKEAQEMLIGMTPLQRLGTPEEIADVVLFLASNGARWITGQILSVSGGLR